MTTKKINLYLLNSLTLFLAFLMFFPILWMFMTSFKTEQIAFAIPPHLVFTPTLENWNVALFESPYFEFLTNSLIITGGSTLVALIAGIPAMSASRVEMPVIIRELVRNSK